MFGGRKEPTVAERYPKLSILAERLNAMGADLPAERFKTNAEGSLNLFLDAIITKLEEVDRRG